MTYTAESEDIVVVMECLSWEERLRSLWAARGF